MSATPADVLAGRARFAVVEADALDVVPALPAACLDAVVTDPPSGIAFMGAEWDRDKGGRAQWVAWLASILGHARAATKDGGRALVWSLPRTSHWTGCAVEDAGWSIETTVTHLFGTGWPKGSSQLKPAAETWWLARTGRSAALNIDACRVATRGERLGGGAEKSDPNSGTGWDRPWRDDPVLAAAAAERQRAAVEHASSVGRYPPNVVFSHAPGCRCVGKRRVACNNRPRNNSYAAVNTYGSGNARVVPVNFGDPDGTETVEAWECVEGCPVAEIDAQSGELTSGAWDGHRNTNKGNGVTLRPFGAVRDEAPREVDRGGASRFYPQFPADEGALFGYHAKSSRAERNAGVDLDARPADAYAAHRHRRMEGEPERFDGAPVGRSANDHPTVKSIALMRWLVRLVTRPGDVVLDPFGGSGTTGAAALAENRRVILVERDPRFAEIARQRCAYASPDLGVPVRVTARAKEPPPVDARQRSLFDLLDGGAR